MSVSDRFLQLMGELAQLAADNADADTAGNKTRRWMIPSNYQNWTGDLTDLESIADAFYRKDLDEWAQEAMAKAKSTAVTAGLKVQLGYLGTMERAFRARHRSPVRAIAQAADRREGHGQGGGVFVGGVLSYVQNILKQAREG